MQCPSRPRKSGASNAGSGVTRRRGGCNGGPTGNTNWTVAPTPLDWMRVVWKRTNSPSSQPCFALGIRRPRLIGRHNRGGPIPAHRCKFPMQRDIGKSKHEGQPAETFTADYPCRLEIAPSGRRLTRASRSRSQRVGAVKMSLERA